MDTRDDDNMENSEKVDIEFHINQFQMLKTVGTGDNDEIIPAIATRQQNEKEILLRRSLCNV